MVCLMQMTKLILNAKLPMYSTKALPQNAPAVKYGNIRDQHFSVTATS